MGHRHECAKTLSTDLAFRFVLGARDNDDVVQSKYFSKAMLHNGYMFLVARLVKGKKLPSLRSNFAFLNLSRHIAVNDRSHQASQSNLHHLVGLKDCVVVTTEHSTSTNQSFLFL